MILGRATVLSAASVALLGACSAERATGPGADGFASVVAGDEFTCALTTLGAAYCWGKGTFGQLGNGATATVAVPAAVAGGRTFASLTAGNAHACGVTTDGSAYCWGLNDFYELGTRTPHCNNNLQFVSCSAVPVAVMGGLRFVALSAAGYATCGIATDGAAYCWGWSTHGQLGNGSTGTVASAPSLVAGGLHFREISADQFHVCGLTTEGSAYCWGSNIHGELGAATATVCEFPQGNQAPCSPTPVAAAGGRRFASISAGYLHSCGATTDGEGYCWGSNANAVLGNPAAAGGVEPVAVAGGHSFASIGAGFDHACGLTTGGDAYCWGLNTYGQVGVPPTGETCTASGTPYPCATMPARVSGGLTFATLSVGTRHSCGATPGGDAYCWGRGADGELGNGAIVSSAVPVRVLPPP